MDRLKISVFCLRDSHYTEQRYTVTEWPRIQEEVTPCKHDLKRSLLVDPQNIFFLNFLPHLVIELGLMKNCAKRMEKSGECFKYLRPIFTGLSDAKLKEGMLIAPRTKNVF